MINFTDCEINNFKYYGGKNGGKICIRYNDEDYMLKFPGVNEGISEHGYSNNCISEYLACNIIKTIEEQQIYDVKELKEFFWDMFIADCLV